MSMHRILGGVAVAASLSAAPAVAQETLSFAHFAAPEHTLQATVIDPFAESVSEATDGALEVRVYPGGELGAGPAEQYVRALQGVADITWGLPGYTSSQFERAMIVEMPGAIPEGMTGYDMLWNAYDEGLLDGEFPGTKPLALWAAEPNILIMRDAEIRSPEDLQGLSIRVSGSIQSDMIEALGATPVQMPATEVYQAMETGLIDGVTTGASAITDFQWQEVANSFTIGAPLGHVSFYVVMNQGRYDGLSPEMQEAIDNASGRELSRSGEEGWNQVADETIASLQEDEGKTVIELSEDEAAAFEDITTQVTEDLVAARGAEDVLATMRGE